MVSDVTAVDELTKPATKRRTAQLWMSCANPMLDFYISNSHKDNLFVACLPDTAPNPANDAGDSYRSSTYSIGYPSEKQSSGTTQSICVVEGTFNRAGRQVAAKVII